MNRATPSSRPFISRIVHEINHPFIKITPLETSIYGSYGYGSKLGTPKLWINTKLDIHICGPINGLPF